MKKEKKLSLRLGMLAGISAMALLATTAGSLAWYAYSRTVDLSFIGTSVAGSSLLRVGLVEGENNVFSDADITNFGLVRETVQEGSKTNKICFSQSKTGFSTAALRKYLTIKGYAVDKLFPVTPNSRAIDAAGAFNLYRSEEDSHSNFTTPAETSGYVKLPFAFKIIDDNAQYVENKQVWITQAAVTSEGGIDSSLRVYVEGTNKFLMKPADQNNTTGSTKVGGLLDLDNDGYYDYDVLGGHEYCYGFYENTPTYSSSTYPEGSQYDVISDVNGVNDENNVSSSFLAKHCPGVHTANIDAAKPLLCHYYNFGKVKPSVRNNGEYYVGDSGIPIATTSNGSKIGYTTLTIYMEGWDYSIVDRNIGYSFNLGLRFEIDRT